jgi:ribose 5-phosphate isomerase A
MNKKQMAGYKAAEYVKDNMVVGLGTGSTAYYMVEKIGEMVKGGLKVKCIPTSVATFNQAKELNIPLTTIDEVESIDLCIDGVDEIDDKFNAVKGGGGALFREKAVAKIAKEVIWIMDDSKLVDAIGAFPLPVEVVPFGYTHVFKKIKNANLNPVLRLKDGKTFVTDNGNYIIDLHLTKPMDINSVNTFLKTLGGIVEVGLFINMCNRIIVGTDNGVKVIENKR